jgi:hypothetical protein
MSDVTPVMCVVVDDVSARDSPQALRWQTGQRPESYGFAQEFLAPVHCLGPDCHVLDASRPDLDGMKPQRCIADDRRPPGGHRSIHGAWRNVARASWSQQSQGDVHTSRCLRRQGVIAPMACGLMSIQVGCARQRHHDGGLSGPGPHGAYDTKEKSQVPRHLGKDSRRPQFRTSDAGSGKALVCPTNRRR